MVIVPTLREWWNTPLWRQIVTEYARTDEAITAACATLTLGPGQLKKVKMIIDVALADAKKRRKIFGESAEINERINTLMWLGKTEIRILHDVVLNEEFLNEYCILFKFYDPNRMEQFNKTFDEKKLAISKTVEKIIQRHSSSYRLQVGGAQAIQKFVMFYFIKHSLIVLYDYYTRSAKIEPKYLK